MHWRCSKNHETIVEGRANRSLYLGFGGERQTRTISLLIPSASSLMRAGAEQLYQVERIIGGIGNMFVSMQCSECLSGEKFRQTRVNNGSIFDSLKVTGCECQSDGTS